MDRLTRRFAFCLASALALPALGAGCAAPQARAQTRAQMMPQTVAQSTPALGGALQSPTIAVPDPKMPGKPQILIRAREIRGISQVGGFSGTLINVYARLFTKGQPTAILTAPHAEAVSHAGGAVVTATGGVVAKSLTQPGTRLTADKMVWYAGQNKIVATGHVVYKNGKSGLTLTGPYMTGDTQIKSITMGSGRASAHL